MVGFAPSADGAAPVGSDNMPKKERKSAFLRAMSRKKSSKEVNAPADAPDSVHLQKTKSGKLARTKTGQVTTTFKDQAILKYPSLAMQQFNGDHGRDLVICGSNSIMAEVCDMVTMLMIMQENSMNLTHSCVERFFEWLPFFGIYLERYFFVEEDVLIRWVINADGPLKGKMRASVRMCFRGKLQKLISDIADLQDKFPRSLPAGERIGLLADAVEDFRKDTTEYFEALSTELPPIINKHFKKADTDKLKSKWVKHVVEHVGTEDFLVLYTRWMPQKDLRDWKTKVLFRTEFKFMAYNTWEKDMDYAHFQIVTTFAEALASETQDDEELKVAKQQEFLRYKDASRKRQKLVNGEEVDGDEYYSDEEEEDYLEYAEEEEYVGE